MSLYFHNYLDPELVYNDLGSEFWKLDGQFHRIDGPAIFRKDGYEAWYYKGLFHRIDGPAIIKSNGTEIWMQHGVLHREDGPAVIYRGCLIGFEEYWINGEQTMAKKDGIIVEQRNTVSYG